MDRLQKSLLSLLGNLTLLLLLFILPRIGLIKLTGRVLSAFGLHAGLWRLLRTILSTLLIASSCLEGGVIVKEFLWLLFGHCGTGKPVAAVTAAAPERISAPITSPKHQQQHQQQKPMSPASAPYSSPLKDSYGPGSGADSGSKASGFSAAQPLQWPRSPTLSSCPSASVASVVSASASASASTASALLSPVSGGAKSSIDRRQKKSTAGPTSHIFSYTAVLNSYLSADNNKGSLQSPTATTAASAATDSKSPAQQQQRSEVSKRSPDGSADQSLHPQQQSSIPSTAAAAPVKPFTRQELTPELSLQYCNMSSDWDVYVENVRSWFVRKILKPLSEDIKQVDAQLEAAGLGHLACRFPATYSMAAKALDSQKSLFGSSGGGSGHALSPASASTASTTSSPSHFFLGTPGPVGKISTLMDLVQVRTAADPLVKARLRIERYLSPAALASQRAAIIKRISAISSGSSITATVSGGLGEQQDDLQLLLHLFCTFMDEVLPSENANDSQPFSSTFFVPLGERPSPRRDAIQLQQVSTQPVTLQLIAEDLVLQAHAGHFNLFLAILFLVDYCHRRRRGYLGIGNLETPRIDLLSILEKK